MKIILALTITFIFSINLSAHELERRNPYNLDNHIESDHFAIYWGTGIDAEKLQSALDALEVAWQVLIIDGGFEAPATSQQYKLNLYVSQTGQPLDDEELHAIQSWDKDDHVAIVFNKNRIQENGFLQLTTTHEFFHAIQAGYYRPRPQTPPPLIKIDWVTESQASWAAQMVWPEYARDEAINHLRTFAPYPQYPLDYITSNTPNKPLLEFYRYGTYVFFNHMIEALNDPSFVVRWLEHVRAVGLTGDRNANALNEMKTMTLNLYNQSFDDLFAQFVARNTVWDYPHGEIYREVINQYIPAEMNQHTVKQYSTADNLWHDSPLESTVRRWGANFIKLKNSTIEELTIGFEGNNLSNRNSDGVWHVTLVLNKDGAYEYIKVPLVDGKVKDFHISTQSADEIWMAIAQTPDSNNDLDIYAYRYQFSEPGKSQASPGTQVEYPIETNEINENSGGGGGDLYFLIVFFSFNIISRKKFFIPTNS